MPNGFLVPPRQLFTFPCNHINLSLSRDTYFVVFACMSNEMS
jgi:hypothetical protein